MPLPQLLISAALVAANAFFVLAEFALARVRPTQVVEWEREGFPGAASVRHAVEHLDAYLAACQLGITMASLGLGAVGEPAFHELLSTLGVPSRIGAVGLAGAGAFGIITVVHVVAGELAPKSVAIARAERGVLLTAPVMRVFYLATKPLVTLFNGMGNLLLKPFGIRPAHEVGHAPPTERELHELLGEAARQRLIDRDEQVLSQNALAYDELRVRQIMVPRRRLRYVTTDMDLLSVVERIREAQVSRIVLCEPQGALDAAVGLLHVNDLLVALAKRPEGPALERLARPLDRVPETMLVDELIYSMRSRGQEFVLVVDEHDTAVGGVALETIVDLLLGGHADGMRREDGALVVPGSALVYAVARALGVTPHDVRQATVGGTVIERLGRLPQVGDVVSVDGLYIEVIDVDDGRVGAARIRAD